MKKRYFILASCLIALAGCTNDKLEGTSFEKVQKSFNSIHITVEENASTRAHLTDGVHFTWDKYEASYNELANDLGNLVQRLATLCKKNSIGGQNVIKRENAEFDTRMNRYEFNFAFDLLWDSISELNKRIDAEKPWALAKTDPDKAKEVLTALVVDLLSINDRLKLFLPEVGDKIEDIFAATEIQPPATPLFPKN